MQTRKALAVDATIIVTAVTGASAADQPTPFFPPVGSVMDFHSVTTIKRPSNPDRVIETDVHREVVANDGLVAKLSNKPTILKDSAVTNLVSVMESPDNYTVYRLFSTAEVSLPTKNQQTGETGRTRLIYDCDKAILQSLLPLGKTPSIQVPCTIGVEINGTAQAPNYVTMTISYEGRSQVTTPAGTFSVDNIRITSQQADNKTDMLYLFDTSKSMLVSA